MQKTFIKFAGLWLSFTCASCTTRLEKWADLHGLEAPSLTLVEGSYKNGRIGSMRPDKGLWFLLTGEDRAVDRDVTIRTDEDVLIVTAEAKGQHLEKHLHFKNRGRYLELEVRYEVKPAKVPLFIFYGSDKIALGGANKSLVVNLSTGGNLSLVILPLLSGGEEFDSIKFDRSSQKKANKTRHPTPTSRPV